jgi:hypothetical protein
MTTTIGSHLWLVDCVGGAGGTVPAEWTRLRDRYYRLQGHGHPLTDRLARGMADPNSDADIDALYAGAVSEWWPNHVDSVMSVVQAHVYPALLALYAPVATKNYRGLADRWNESARAFTACTELVDVTANPDLVLNTADRRGIQAWQDAPKHAARLDEQLTALAAAAVLAGAEGDPGSPTFDQPTLAIPLTVNNIDRLHRRHAWNRWALRADDWPPLQPLTKQAVEAAMHAPATPAAPRCGKWSGLVALGATLRAHTKPSDLKLFEPPAAHFVEWVRNPRGSYDCVRRDPEDGRTGQPIKAGASPSIAGVAE